MKKPSYYFRPDAVLDDIYQITPEYLKKRDISGLILDIDNTLAPYSMPEPDEKLLVWFGRLREAGVQAAFLSNNSRRRVELFCRGLNGIFIAKAGKPLRGGIRKSLARMGLGREKVILVGDQIFTDILAGKRAGLFSVLVKPIEGPKSVFQKFKRYFEKPFVKG